MHTARFGPDRQKYRLIVWNIYRWRSRYSHLCGAEGNSIDSHTSASYSASATAFAGRGEGRQRRRWWCWFGVETFPTHAATQTQAHLHCSTFMVTGFPGVWRGEALPTLSKCLKVYTLPTGACGFVALPANPGPSCTFL